MAKPKAYPNLAESGLPPTFLEAKWMSIAVKVAEVKTVFSELLTKVEASEEVIIARGNDCSASS